MLGSRRVDGMGLTGHWFGFVVALLLTISGMIANNMHKPISSDELNYLYCGHDLDTRVGAWSKVLVVCWGFKRCTWFVLHGIYFQRNWVVSIVPQASVVDFGFLAVFVENSVQHSAIFLCAVTGAVSPHTPLWVQSEFLPNTVHGDTGPVAPPPWSLVTYGGGGLYGLCACRRIS